MKKILFANYLALLFACDLPNVENPSLESIKSEVIMEDFDTNDLLNWNIVNDTVMGGASKATLKLTNDKYTILQIDNPSKDIIEKTLNIF